MITVPYPREQFGSPIAYWVLHHPGLVPDATKGGNETGRACLSSDHGHNYSLADMCYFGTLTTLTKWGIDIPHRYLHAEFILVIDFVPCLPTSTYQDVSIIQVGISVHTIDAFYEYSFISGSQNLFPTTHYIYMHSRQKYCWFL